MITNEALADLMAKYSGLFCYTSRHYGGLLQGHQKSYICNNTEKDILYNGVLYFAAGFKYTPPEDKRGLCWKCLLSICTVDQTIPDHILRSSSHPSFTVRAAYIFATGAG